MMRYVAELTRKSPRVYVLDVNPGNKGGLYNEQVTVRAHKPEQVALAIRQQFSEGLFGPQAMRESQRLCEQLLGLFARMRPQVGETVVVEFTTPDIPADFLLTR